MKLPNIVLTPMEESPTMLEAWTRLKHVGRVMIHSDPIGHREMYTVIVESHDGRKLGEKNEDLYRAFLNIYHKIAREIRVTEARENRLRGSDGGGVIYDEVEKVWLQRNNSETHRVEVLDEIDRMKRRQSEARIHQRMVRRNEMEDVETTYQPKEATIGTFVTATTTAMSPTNNPWSCQGWIICESPLKVIGRTGRVYECSGKPTVITNPPQIIPGAVLIELNKARDIKKESVEKCQDIW